MRFVPIVGGFDEHPGACRRVGAGRLKGAAPFGRRCGGEDEGADAPGGGERPARTGEVEQLIHDTSSTARACFVPCGTSAWRQAALRSSPPMEDRRSTSATRSRAASHDALVTTRT